MHSFILPARRYMHVSVSCLLHFLISVFYRDRCIELVYGWTGPILYCKEILVSAKLKSTFPCHYVPNLEIFATAHRLSSRVVSLAGQRWTLSVITRSSSVELSWQYLRLSTFDRTARLCSLSHWASTFVYSTQYARQLVARVHLR